MSAAHTIELKRALIQEWIVNGVIRMAVANIKWPRQLPDSGFAGHYIRRARKPGRCDYGRGYRDDRPAMLNGRCPNEIAAGDYYLEGEMNEAAGGYGHDRYCLECVATFSPFVRAALTAAGVTP